MQRKRKHDSVTAPQGSISSWERPIGWWYDITPCIVNVFVGFLFACWYLFLFLYLFFFLPTHNLHLFCFSSHLFCFFAINNVKVLVYNEIIFHKYRNFFDANTMEQVLMQVLVTVFDRVRALLNINIKQSSVFFCWFPVCVLISFSLPILLFFLLIICTYFAFHLTYLAFHLSCFFFLSIILEFWFTIKSFSTSRETSLMQIPWNKS